mmetsp:Transcript_9232/g.30835  ORF Transcript_9232/g.30835 Transcript_9232/m.30835 type:complete len:211 (+) Transcript_9232:861-1493(+)
MTRQLLGRTSTSTRKRSKSCSGPKMNLSGSLRRWSSRRQSSALSNLEKSWSSGSKNLQRIRGGGRRRLPIRAFSSASERWRREEQRRKELSPCTSMFPSSTAAGNSSGTSAPCVDSMRPCMRWRRATVKMRSFVPLLYHPSSPPPATTTSTLPSSSTSLPSSSSPAPAAATDRPCTTSSKCTRRCRTQRCSTKSRALRGGGRWWEGDRTR